MREVCELLLEIRMMQGNYKEIGLAVQKAVDESIKIDYIINNALENAGLREKVILAVGGAPVTRNLRTDTV